MWRLQGRAEAVCWYVLGGSVRLQCLCRPSSENKQKISVSGAVSLVPFTSTKFTEEEGRGGGGEWNKQPLRVNLLVTSFYTLFFSQCNVF